MSKKSRRWPDKSLWERFWEKVDRRSDEECWPWKGPLGKRGSGYGSFTVHNHYRPTAHRAAYELFFKVAAGHLDVCHTCDNGWCCNPHHMFLGTRKENMQDAAKKGRTIRGENHPDTILSDFQVQEIRRKLKTGALQRELAMQFGVSRQHISGIKLFKYRQWIGNAEN